MQNNPYLTFNSPCTEGGTFQEKWLNTMAADAQAPCVAWSSAVMSLSPSIHLYPVVNTKIFINTSE